MAWVCGAGKFGRQAVLALYKNYELVVIDRHPPDNLPDGVVTVQSDAVVWLAEHLTPQSQVSAIIPALPLHLAADWLSTRLEADGLSVSKVPLPSPLLDNLPNPVQLSPSRAVLSYANFICPPSCSEPKEICTHTGKRRPLSLYKLLENIESPPFSTIVIRSRQVGPGIGGYSASDLFQLYQQVQAKAKHPLLIATACRCHGILDALALALASK